MSVNVLFTTPMLEFPAAGGPQLRIENSIKALSSVCNLFIFHQASYLSRLTISTHQYYSREYPPSLPSKYPSNKYFRRVFELIDKIYPLSDRLIAIKIIIYVYRMI